MIDPRWKKTIFRSFRLSPALLEMIEAECKYLNTSFSDYIRGAALSAMKRGNRVTRMSRGSAGASGLGIIGDTFHAYVFKVQISY